MLLNGVPPLSLTNRRVRRLPLRFLPEFMINPGLPTRVRTGKLAFSAWNGLLEIDMLPNGRA